MGFIGNLILFIIILGVIVTIHEFGHFLFAKLFDVYVYEFSIGMGPVIWKYKPKNKKGKKKSETEYSIRAIPIGGFCSLAGEDYENDKDKVPKNRLLQSKSAWQRFLIMFMGPGFNFLLAFFLLFNIALIWGAPSLKPVISSVDKSLPAYNVGISKGDIIKEINGKKVTTMDDVSLYLVVAGHKKETSIKVEKYNGIVKTYKLKPMKVTKVDDGGKKSSSYKFGIGLKGVKQRGIVNAFTYSIVKTKALFKQMFITVSYLINGTISTKQLSGPVGIYSIVGSQAKDGLSSILYLIAYLSINVGFINLIPLPAFDGGHILFIIIEKIIGRPVDAKIENTIHTIGLILLLILMVFVTFNDIVRLFS